MAAVQKLSLKTYRNDMCEQCRNNVRLLNALLKVEDTQYELKKAEREAIKQMREVNKRNPNPHADEKEKLAFAMARVPQVFQQLEDLKRKYMDVHRELTDIKIDIKCLNKFAPGCSPAECRGMETSPRSPAAKTTAKKTSAKTASAKTTAKKTSATTTAAKTTAKKAPAKKAPKA